MSQTLSPRHLTLSLLAIVFAAAGSLSLAPAAHAAGAATLSGYAWSSNIGWVSFSCANTSSCSTVNYGVSADASGNLSGYAWSSNIGWISFNQTSGCPEAGCTTQPKIDPSSGAVSGWAKALAADNNGWDGWIKLGGSWAPSVVFSSGAAAGYSWGADVVGWLRWSGLGYGVTETFASCPATTIGSCVLPATSSGNTAGQCAPGYTGSCSYSCASGTWTPVSNSCAVPTPTATITASPSRVRSGGTVTVSWNAANVNSCDITRNGTPIFNSPIVATAGTVSNAGTLDPTPITAQTTYAMDCKNAAGSVVVTATPVVVNIAPTYNEF